MTPLLRAAANGRAEITRWLLAEGADPAAVDLDHNSALALSCRGAAGGRLDAAKALLDAGADVLAENSDGESCVSLAALSGRTELLDMMLAAMAGSGQRFRDGGGSMLYDAVDHGLSKASTLEALLQYTRSVATARKRVATVFGGAVYMLAEEHAL